MSASLRERVMKETLRGWRMGIQNLKILVFLPDIAQSLKSQHRSPVREYRLCSLHFTDLLLFPLQRITNHILTRRRSIAPLILRWWSISLNDLVNPAQCPGNRSGIAKPSNWTRLPSPVYLRKRKSCARRTTFP